MDSAKIAINMEGNSRNFYQEQSEIAKFDSEKAFYKALAGQENGHYLLLLDYLEFLQDPAGYYSRTEHHSLDG
jgi:rubrerythrin